MNEPGIYLHVPFCQKKCGYCSFYSVTDYEKWIFAYRKAVIRDIQETRQLLGDEKPDTLYIGGGTPSLLPLSEWNILLPLLIQDYPLKEVTMEINPGTVDEAKIAQYKESGVNRLSIGIQSLSDDILTFLGRIHNQKQARETIEIAKKIFPNFSVDIIFSIPGFPFSSFENTVKSLVENYLPPHISAYSLTIEQDTPFFERKISSDDSQFEKEYCWLHDYLATQGYIHYEVSNYALPGYLALHNSKYWERVPYLGIGPSAHSLWQEKRFEYQNKEDFFQSTFSQKYRESGSLTQEEIRTEKIMLGARTLKGIPLSLLFPSQKKLKIWEDIGLIEMKQDKIFLTWKGWMVMNSIVLELL